MIEEILKNKLKSLGYTQDFIEEKLKEIDLNVLTTKKDFSEKDIEIVKLYNPNVNLARAFLNIDAKYLQSVLIDGKIDLKKTLLPTGANITVMDYRLDENVCVFLITNDLKVEIYSYVPDANTKAKYAMQTYEQVYANDRENVINEYIDALTENNRLLLNKAREVLNLLASDFVIDEMIINNVSPILKLYDNPEKFAENITNYNLKYINRRLNRIEVSEKVVLVKRAARGLKFGYLTNDPYAKLNEINHYADFYLNMVSYFWIFSNEKGQEEIGIYTAPETESKTYRQEQMKNRKDIDAVARDICMQFTNQVRYQISEEAIRDILYKLNHQLVAPPIDYILKYAENPDDPIEPLSYKYRAISDPTEFENRLYNSIEDNIGRRYKYKLTENVLEDLTTIGNKLDYTDENGKLIKKQSIADFNQNGNAVIIRRETLIDIQNIPELLGYIYEDIDSKGTDNLPVPSIEVDFYFPNSVYASEGIKMYNGTDYEVAAKNISTGNKFYSADKLQNSIYSENNNVVQGGTRVTVRYLANTGEVLKENVISNVFPGDNYVPEVLPVISDKSGKEWICKITRMPNLILSDVEENNKIEIKYVAKMTKAKLSFYNRENQKLANDKIIEMQVGTEINNDEYSTVVDKEGIEWDLVESKPKKSVISEREEQNHITFIYDVTRVAVVINYKNKQMETLKKSITVQAIADKKYTAKIDPILKDDNGLYWVYISEAAASIVPHENEVNTIDLIYDQMKTKVTTMYYDENGEKVKDDFVEFIQIGKEYTANYDEKFRDLQGKMWKFQKVNKSSLIVKEELTENEIKVVYEPLTCKIIVRIVDENGRKLHEDIYKEMQVGSIYDAEKVGNLKDLHGKIWRYKGGNTSLEVTEDESKNIISFVYEPLLTKITVRYFDIEKKEIIPSKEFIKQAGENCTLELPNHLEDKEGKKWILPNDTEKNYIVKESEEENRISIYYEKELTDVELSFKDLYGNALADDVTVKWQIGDSYSAMAYRKIKDYNNGRWSQVSSEPKNMVVREKSNHFVLFYDEIKTTVIIKYINLQDEKSIKEPEQITTKLGITYVPNLKTEYIDSNKLHWSYVGEKDVSIVTQEEEQSNVIVLKYEPKNAKVIVKYLNEDGLKLAEDNIKEMQIGREVEIKRIENLYSNDKKGWIIQKMSNTSIRVSEDENQNIITCVYKPWLEKVTVRYKNQNGVELIKPLVKELQVGAKFKAEVIDIISDNSGKAWDYNGKEQEEITVKEQDNEIDLVYQPELKKIFLKFVSNDIELIPMQEQLVQVGEKFIPKYEQELIDAEGKHWIYFDIDKDEVVVTEDESQNIVNIKYEPKLVEVMLNFTNEKGEIVKTQEKQKVQMGSTLIYTPELHVIDKSALGWEANQKECKFKITEEVNTFTIQYQPYLVNVYDKIVDEEGNEITATITLMSKQQVGSKYTPNIQEVLVDTDEKEWLYLASKINGNTTIKVSEEEEKNNVYLKYTPSLADVVIKYVDTLGNVLKNDSVVKAQIGSEFSADVIEKIKDPKGNKWIYNPNSKNLIKVKKENNQIVLSYEEQKALVTYKYQDEYGNRLKAPTKTLVQIGSIYRPEVESVIEDDQEKVWEYKERDLESIEIKDAEQDNVFVLIYVPLKVDVTLYIKNTVGKEIKEPLTVKAQLGADFKPNVDATITDDNSFMYKFVRMEPEQIKIKETPIGSTENVNVFTLIYDEVYSTVSIRYQDFDGNVLREEEKEQIQVGTKYTPKIIQYIKDKKGNQWELVTNEQTSIRVMENAKENIIKFVYEVAKSDVIVKFKDTEGNNIKEEEHFNIQIGNEFVPEIPKHLLDKAGKKWSFFNCDPVKLKVGSINNVITVSYQEEKTTVYVRYQDDTGRKLKVDDRLLVQIGSNFKPKITTKVIYDENEIWRFSHMQPAEIIVSENPNENVITQVYTNKEIEEIPEEKVEVPEEKEKRVSVTDVVKKQETEKVEKEESKFEAEKTYVYANKNLKALEKVMLLTDDQKRELEKINSYNNELVKILQENLDKNKKGLSTDFSKIEKLIEQEKDIIKDRSQEILEEDRSGSKLLKIFEIVVEPFEKNETFDTLQQRKAVLMADYCVNKSLTDAEQAVYICTKGKNDRQLQIIDNLTKAGLDTSKLKTQLQYEKILLENYYRARSIVKDSYFTDEASKGQLPQEVVIAVNNMLINQTYNLLIKNELTLPQELELSSLYQLLNQMQRDKIEQMVGKIPDNKQRKAIQKKLKEL